MDIYLAVYPQVQKYSSSFLYKNMLIKWLFSYMQGMSTLLIRSQLSSVDNENGEAHHFNLSRVDLLSFLYIIVIEKIIYCIDVISVRPLHLMTV